MSETPSWIDLVTGHRWAALGTIDDDGAPLVSSVAYAPASSPEPCLLMHLSQLAIHTRNLLSRQACSLLISEPDNLAVDDPQTLARISLIGNSLVIPRESNDFVRAGKEYLGRFPEAKMRFEFSDFHLFRFVPARGNFVGGFGSAEKISGQEIESSLRNSFP